MTDIIEGLEVNTIDFICSECGNSPRRVFSGDGLATESQKSNYDGTQCPLHWWPSDGCDGTLINPEELIKSFKERNAAISELKARERVEGECKCQQE